MTTTQSKFVHVNPGKPKPPKLEVRTDPDGTRFYRSPKGIWYPSASTVAGWEKKDFFAEWAKNPQNAIEADRARQRGNLLHEVTERYLNNEEGYLDSFGHNTRYKMLFQQIKPHLKKINLIRAQELAMYSDTIQMAGRVDCVADYEGELSIIDFKGSRKTKKEEWIEHYLIQATAYAIMWQERFEIAVKQIVIIIACEDGNDQVFVRNPKQYVKRLKEVIDKFQQDNAEVLAELNAT